jgi:hypothetical protein
MKRAKSEEVGGKFNIIYHNNEMISINNNIKSRYCRSCKKAYYFTRKNIFGFCGFVSQ